MKLTKKQEELLRLLRFDGLAREIELHEAEEAYEKAQEVEKAVTQYVVDNNEYYADCPDIPELHEKRITDGFEAFDMGEKLFTEDYLPKVKAAYMELYGIDNPLDFVYSYPMLKLRQEAEQNYLLIAVDFLKICGAPEAAELEKSVKTYMREDLRKRLMDLNESFISGKTMR